MSIYQGTDEMGISAVENASIDALSEGASRDQVSELTGQPIEDVPEMVTPSYSVSEFEDNEEYSSTDDFEPSIQVNSHKDSAKKALYASFAARDVDGTVYEEVYNQLRNNGSSPSLESLKESLRMSKGVALKEEISESARTGDINNTQKLLQAFPEVLEKRSTLRTNALENSLDGSTEDPRAIESQAKFLNDLYNNSHVQEVWNKYIDSAVANSSDDLGVFSTNLLEQTFVGEQLLGLSKAAKEVFGERYLFQSGTMLEDFSKYIKGGKDKEEIENRTVEVVDSIVKNSSSVQSKNDLIKTFVLEDLRTYLNTPGDRKLNTLLLNVAGYAEILNVVGAGGTVGKAIKGLSKITKSSSSVLRSGANLMSDLQKASPALDAKLTSSALKSKVAAEKLGVTQAEAISRTFPSNYIDEDIILEGAPNSLKNLMGTAKTLAHEAGEYLENTFIYKDADYLNKEKKIAAILKNNKNLIEAKPSYSSFKRDPNSTSLIVKMTYGDETDLPLNYIKAQEISETITDVFKKNGITVTPTLSVKDSITGNYRTFDNAVDVVEESQFLVNISQKMRLTPGDVIGDIPLSEGTTQSKLASVISSEASSYLLEPENYIERTLLGAARVSNDAKFYTQHNLLSIAEPFYKLNWRGKKHVAELLDVGEQEGKVFKYRELDGLFSPKEIEAYYSARMLNDTVYGMKNADTRTRLIADGYKGMSVKLDNDKFFKNAVKIVDSPAELGKIRTIFDPRTGKGSVFSFNDVEKLKLDGYSIGKLLRKADKGEEAFSYTLVKGEDIHELPSRVFPYREGYNFRVNNDPYFITEKVKKVIDGESVYHTRTIAAAKDINQANKHLEDLRKANSKSVYDVKIDRNVSSTDSALKADMDALDGSGLNFWFSERGERLLRVDGSVSAVQDPLSSMTSMISSTANVHTHREFIEAAVTRHRLTYGDIEINGKKLWRWDSELRDYKFHKENAKSVGRKDVAAALSEYQYLENLTYAPTKVDVQWKQLMEGFDRYFGESKNSLVRAASKKAFIEGGMSTTPGKALRGTAFALTIPLRPTRHLVLQGLSGLHLTGVNPKAVLPALRDGNILMLRFATEGNPKSIFSKAANSLARASGYTDEEWNTIFEAFRKSGKGHSIDSNVMVGEANFTWSRSIPETALGETARKLSVAAKSPFTLGKKLGFDLGEFGNQALTYMFAVKQWQKNNPAKKLPTTKMEWDQIYSDSRSYSIDMTKTSSFKYQRGAFASMTQFMAINHKMALNILGQNPAISMNRKAQAAYIGGMLSMYGAAGIGLQDFYDSWSKSLDIDLPPEVDDILYGGFSQAIFNKSLQLAFGLDRGEVRTAFSDSFSPAGGVFTFPVEFVDKMLDGNFLEALAGPASTLMPKMGEAAKYIKDTWGFSELDTPEKLIRSAQVAFREFGMFSDMYKLNMAKAYRDQADKLFIVGRDGRPSAEANSFEEVYAKAVLGLNLRSEQELFTKWKDDYQEVRSSGKKHEAQIDTDAKHLVKYMYETYSKYGVGLKFREKMLPITYSLHRGDKMYAHEVYKASRRLLREDPMFSTWATDIFKKHALLDADADFDDMRNAVRHSDAIPEDSKERVSKAIDALESSSEAARDRINNVEI